MFYQELDNDGLELVFRFFYKFSRFEYSLKANNFCKADGNKCKASADWIKFRETYENEYALSDAATGLLQSPPKLQVYINTKLEFVDERHDHDDSDLRKVIRSIQRIRNNLFHGGKHGSADEGSRSRNKYLLTAGCTILDELSRINSDIEYDYPGRY